MRSRLRLSLVLLLVCLFVGLSLVAAAASLQNTDHDKAANDGHQTSLEALPPLVSAPRLKPSPPSVVCAAHLPRKKP